MSETTGEDENTESPILGVKQGFGIPGDQGAEKGAKDQVRVGYEHVRKDFEGSLRWGGFAATSLAKSEVS